MFLPFQQHIEVGRPTAYVDRSAGSVNRILAAVSILKLKGGIFCQTIGSPAVSRVYIAGVLLCFRDDVLALIADGLESGFRPRLSGGAPL